MVAPWGASGGNPAHRRGSICGRSPPGGRSEFDAVPSRSGARLSRYGRPLGRSAGVKGRAVPAPVGFGTKSQGLAPCVSFFCVFGSYRLRVRLRRRRRSGGRGENLPGGGRGQSSPVGCGATPRVGVGLDQVWAQPVGGRPFPIRKRNQRPP